MNERRVTRQVGVAALTAELADVTASLLAPIFRLFDGWDVNADYVHHRLTRRRRR